MKQFDIFKNWKPEQFEFLVNYFKEINCCLHEILYTYEDKPLNIYLIKDGLIEVTNNYFYYFLDIKKI